MHFKKKNYSCFYLLQDYLRMVNNTYGKRFSYLQKCTHVSTLFEKTCSKGIVIYSDH